MAARSALGGATALLLAACQSGLDAPAELPPLDEAYFRCRVQPVLVKSCAAFACHGNAERFFRVFGRNRLRYGLAEEERNAFLAAAEGRHNFDAARAFVDAGDPDASWLLLKPLEQRAGGYYHGGATEYGQGDVFTDTSDADYETLAAWGRGGKEDPQCVEPGSDL